MAADNDTDMCWICLEEAAENGSHQLMSPCKCPRKVHPQCLARWQLQQAGRHEEKFCRFCNNELADWKGHLTPEELKPEVSKVQPIMVVYFEGQIHRIPVKQGPDGLDEFTGKIRELFRLPEDVDISLTFGCKEPMSGTHLKLEGMGAFDAAVHCASVAAAERQQKIKKSHSTGNLGATPGLPPSAPAPMARSASNSAIPAAPSAASSPAAGLSAASPAAQDRRHRFHGAAQQQQQQPGGRGGAARSRSFSHGSQQPGAAAPGGVEPPAAFRSILGMLGGAPGAGGGGAAAAAAGAGEQQQLQRASSAAIRAGAAGQAPAQLSLHGLGSAGSSPCPSPGAWGGAGASPVSGAGGQQQQQQTAAPRLKRERFSLRNITELTDVPEADETVAIGSLSGKFKLHLKAFSRKVARSLSFTSKGSHGSMASAGSVGDFGDSSSAYSSSSHSPSPRVGSYGAGSALSMPSPRSLSSSPLPLQHRSVRA